MSRWRIPVIVLGAMDDTQLPSQSLGTQSRSEGRAAADPVIPKVASIRLRLP